MAKVLLADDDAVTRDSMARVAEAEGHLVLEAQDGFEAVEQALAESPDIIFLATALAVYSGFETCEILRADPDVGPDVPVILLTPSAVDHRAVARAGATDTLPKQHEVAELRDILVKYLGSKAVP